jgi:Na+/H+-dicarboxylate symporter
VNITGDAACAVYVARSEGETLEEVEIDENVTA